MHRRILLAMLVTASLAAAQTMDIHLWAGGTDTYGIDNIRKLTWLAGSPTQLLIHQTSGTVDSTAITAVRKITFDVSVGNRRDLRKVARLKNALMSILPNPVTHAAVVSFSLAGRGKVLAQVFNGKGELVRTITNQHMNAGVHRVVWDGSTNRKQRVGAGTYVVRVVIDDVVAVRKLTVIR
jgi:hypothetical protein